jgi:hypothetical protein
MSLDNPENHDAQFKSSPVLDSVYGFGNNGVNGSTDGLPPYPAGALGDPLGSCVEKSPFAGLKIILDPGESSDLPSNLGAGRCLKRNLPPLIADQVFSWPKNIATLLRQQSLANFTYYKDKDLGGTGAKFGVHGSGHTAIGGEVRRYLVSSFAASVPCFLSDSWPQADSDKRCLTSGLQITIQFSTYTMAISIDYGGCGRSDRRRVFTIWVDQYIVMGQALLRPTVLLTWGNL